MPIDRLSTTEGTPAATPDQRMRPRHRIAPGVALMLLAPWAAECSWGGFTLADYPLVLVFLAPLYGGAAVLIRETARRMGAGWPAIALLAAAFGMYQAGLVDQSLFNAGYLDDTEFRDWSVASEATTVPLLGFSATEAISFIGNHIALSICAPIAIIESFLPPERRHRPWLRAPGTAVVGVLFLLGSLLIFAAEDGRKGFMAGPLQLTFAAVVILVLIAAAALPRWRRPREAAPHTVRATGAPHPLWAGLVELSVHLSAYTLSGWGAVAVQLTAVAGATLVIVGWSRRTGWGQRHVLAAWAAGLIAAAGGAYAVPNYAPASPVEALVGDIAGSVITVALVTAAFLRLRVHDRGSVTQPAGSPSTTGAGA